MSVSEGGKAVPDKFDMFIFTVLFGKALPDLIQLNIPVNPRFWTSQLDDFLDLRRFLQVRVIKPFTLLLWKENVILVECKLQKWNILYYYIYLRTFKLDKMHFVFFVFFKDDWYVRCEKQLWHLLVIITKIPSIYLYITLHFLIFFPYFDRSKFD